MARSRDQVLGGMLADLPPGWTWDTPRTPGSTFARLLEPQAGELALLEAGMEGLLAEADPRTADLLLSEWERAYGLPDECSVGVTLVSARRAALIARLTERRSPTPAAIEAVAAAYGVRASVVEYREHTCEMDCEAAVTGTPWVHAFDVWSGTRVITEATAEDDCEQPLRVWVSQPHECAVRRMAPAHSVPLFQSFQDEFSLLGGLPAGGAVARTGNATRVDERGLLASVADNAPRLSYNPALTYSQQLNPWADGAVSGTGTKPTSWGFIGGAGTSVTFFTGSTDGIPHVDVRFQGTTTNTNGLQIIFNSPGTNAPQARAGETWTGEFRAQLVAGTLPNQPSISVAEYNGTTYLVNSGASAATTDVLQRTTLTRTLTNAATNNLQFSWTCAAGIGLVVDFTVRIVFPILAQSPSPLTDAVPLATLAARDNGVPQYGLLGLLNERGSDNFIPNPRGEGAVAGVIGSGGVAPTDWGTVSAGGGLATQIVGTGTEAGVPYVDIRWSGTASATGFITVQFLSTAVAPIAAWDQTWTASAFRRLVGGSFAGLFNARLNITEYLGATFLVGTSSLSTPTSDPLAVQRGSVTRRLTDPLVDRVICSWAASFNAGAVVDITMRLGAPQLEQGPLSSVMLPSAGFPGVASRSAEALSIPAPTGGYSADITAATPSGAVAPYAASGLTSMQGSLHVAHPAAAVDAGATAIRTIQLRKVR